MIHGCRYTERFTRKCDKDEPKDNRAEYETESEADEEIPYCLCCDLFVDLEITCEEEF